MLIRSAMPSMTKEKRTNGCVNGYPGTVPFQNSIKNSQLLDLHVSITVEPQPSALRGLGTDIAILDSAYLLSQVVPSLFMGFIVQLFHSVTAYMACASLLSLVAVYFSRKIIFEKTDVDARWLRCYQESNRLRIMTKNYKGQLVLSIIFWKNPVGNVQFSSITLAVNYSAKYMVMHLHKKGLVWALNYLKELLLLNLWLTMLYLQYCTVLYLLRRAITLLKMKY